MNNAHNAYANTVRIILVLVILGTLWVSFDGLHYWHDIRFMYATSQFSMQDILSGQFNPHQAWGPINEKSAAGFYSSKVLHICIFERFICIYSAARWWSGFGSLLVCSFCLPVSIGRLSAFFTHSSHPGIRRFLPSSVCW